MTPKQGQSLQARIKNIAQILCDPSSVTFAGVNSKSLIQPHFLDKNAQK